MFTGLGTFFTRGPRQAEKTDTRLGIRHHEPDQERRKPKKNDRNEAQIFGDNDDAVITVDALYVFLTNFLKSQEKQAASPDITSQAPNTPAGEQKQAASPDAASGPAAQAARIYQSAASTAEKPHHIESGEPQGIEDSALQSHEIRTIHGLLDDLKTLSARNVEYLKIERSASFLESLVNAVEKAKRTL